ncbi:hypothetical protein PF004_g7689 [Phytophthora fragariae]|uniref:Uncharacterized protein n=1 Tax=Phytophthora fragariae TaxID=53985 RepID=A0A6G0P8Z4_9STRA|nr:hypothetical protein PF004_g7689 [Phytophthora fragariae]
MVSPGRDTPEQCRFLPATRTGLKLESVEGAAIAAGDKKKNVKGCYEDNQVVARSAGAIESASEAAPPVAATPPPQRRTGNEYVDRIIQASGLYIIRDKEVQAAYNARGELGFFSLFFTREFRASLQSWTNKTLKKKGIQEGT